MSKVHMIKRLTPELEDKAKELGDKIIALVLEYFPTAENNEELEEWEWAETRADIRHLARDIALSTVPYEYRKDGQS